MKIRIKNKEKIVFEDHIDFLTIEDEKLEFIEREEDFRRIEVQTISDKDKNIDTVVLNYIVFDDLGKCIYSPFNPHKLDFDDVEVAVQLNSSYEDWQTLYLKKHSTEAKL